ncbi:MAG: 3-hydroxyacyl-ACP dehydratase FabZ [Desulfuromonadales bacterium]|nr:3-hydroxyacyl-ACP dehydratase FabZ [Desulfuromonadales bacterium]
MNIDINQIMQILPHRYPFLLVDRVIEHEVDKKIVCIKNVTINEPFFQGHFPGHPVMPGVLMVEAMAQAGGLLVGLSKSWEFGDKICYFVSVDNCKFRKPVFPGDQLRIEMEVVVCKRGIWSFVGKVYAEDKLVAEADLKATFLDRP